jgi:hypothetical protein
MPYIAKARRAPLTPKMMPQSKGELNFVATMAAIGLIVERLSTGADKLGYHVISEAIAALRDAADEMQRRLLNPTEDRAIKKNGDIYPKWLLEGAGVAQEAPPTPPHEAYYSDRPDFRYGSGKDPREILGEKLATEVLGPWDPKNTNNW